MTTLKLEKMQAVRFRAIGWVDEDVTFALMDAADKGRILMFMKITTISAPDRKFIRAIDLLGNHQFDILTFNESERKVILYSNIVGTLRSGDSLDETTLECEMRPNDTLLATAATESVLPGKVFQICDKHGLMVSHIDQRICSDSVEIFMQKSLELHQKILLLAFAVEVCYCEYNIHNVMLPHLVCSKACSIPWNVLSESYTSNDPLDILTQISKAMIRAAGFSRGSNVVYYDVIEHVTGHTLFTFETLTSYPVIVDGEVIVKNHRGNKMFAIFNILSKWHFQVSSVHREVFGIYHEFQRRFRSARGKRIDFHMEPKQREVEGDSRTPKTVLEIYGSQWDVLATISAKDCAVIVEFTEEVHLDGTYRALVFSLAIRSLFTVYGFHRLPMPEIEYFYPDQKNGRKSVFA